MNCGGIVWEEPFELPGIVWEEPVKLTGIVWEEPVELLGFVWEEPVELPRIFWEEVVELPGIVVREGSVKVQERFSVRSFCTCTYECVNTKRVQDLH